MSMEKVIKGLEICSEHGSWHGLDCEHNEAYKDCPYRGCETGCVVTIAKDAISLLKEQDATIKAQQFVLNNACEKLKEQKIAMKPKNIDKVGGNCPVCGLRMARSDKYCSQCGQGMDWK